jgi:hypothetical protein
VAQDRRHALYEAKLDEPATRAFVTEEAHLTGVDLDNRFKTIGAARRTTRERAAKEVLLGLFHHRHLRCAAPFRFDQSSNSFGDLRAEARKLIA